MREETPSEKKLQKLFKKVCTNSKVYGIMYT